MSNIEQLEETAKRRRVELSFLEEESVNLNNQMNEEGYKPNSEDTLYRLFLNLQREGIEKHLCQIRYEKFLCSKMDRKV